MISIRDIQAIVRQYPAEFSANGIEPLRAAGGMSGAQFWRIESPSGNLALRRWPSEHPTPERLRFIHQTLFHAGTRGIPFLPIPIPTATGESFVRLDGYLWELSPWMPGTADYQRSPSNQKLAAAMKALARFHVAVNDFPPTGLRQVAGQVPAISRRLSRLRELSHRGTDDLARAVDANIWPKLAPLAQRFLSLMPKILPRAINQLTPLANIVLPVQPCIRDVWHDHVLFTRDEVTGIIDFGALNIDTPATDVARLLDSLVGDDEAGWRTALGAYTAIRPLSADEERAATALDATSPVLAGCNWLRWIYVDNRHFEEQAPIVDRFGKIVTRAEFAATS